jgi:hypothetical protein
VVWYSSAWVYMYIVVCRLCVLIMIVVPMYQSLLVRHIMISSQVYKFQLLIQYQDNIFTDWLNADSFAFFKTVESIFLYL